MSILENIRLGNLKATDEECKNAGRLACIDEFIEGIGGYQARCGRKGGFLSGGQKQICVSVSCISPSSPKL
jgi:ABC-type multidrug transport system fused ATPase/permease subunit